MIVLMKKMIHKHFMFSCVSFCCSIFLSPFIKLLGKSSFNSIVRTAVRSQPECLEGRSFDYGKGLDQLELNYQGSFFPSVIPWASSQHNLPSCCDAWIIVSILDLFLIYPLILGRILFVLFLMPPSDGLLVPTTCLPGYFFSWITAAYLVCLMSRNSREGIKW